MTTQSEQMNLIISYIRFKDLTMEQLCGFVKTFHKCDVKQGLTKDETIAWIKKMNEKMINQIKRKEEKQNFIQTQLTESERTTFYPKQILDENGLCMCENCLDCYPSKFRGMKKPRQCVTCECYNLREIKTVDDKIYCLDCYEEEGKNEYMEEDMGECPKCDCAVKRKDLAWRIGYYLDICAKCDEEEEEEQETPIKPRGVIQNCCFNCDEETTNKITVNKGKTNEREDFLCELCVIDINEINKNKK